MNEFKDKVAIVTGAGKGIGHALALSLVHKGVRLVVNDTDNSSIDHLVEKIKKVGGQAVKVVGNAGSLECINQLVHMANKSYGTIDIAVANAGITTFGRFLDYTESQLQELVEVNLKGSFFLCQAVAKEMITNKNKGRILLMSSVTAYQYHRDLVAYGMTKAAIRFLAKSLGVELSQYGITVNALAPGATKTERTSQLDENYQRSWEQITPDGQIASVQDICSAALYFFSQDASHVTGQTLVIDGGWTSISPQPKSF